MKRATPITAIAGQHGKGDREADPQPVGQRWAERGDLVGHMLARLWATRLQARPTARRRRWRGSTGRGRGLVRRARPGGRAAALLRADRRRPLEPDLRGHRRRRAALGAAPPAARQAPRLRPRHGPRAPGHLGARGHRRAGRPGRRPLRGRERSTARPSTSWSSSRGRSCAALAEAEAFPDEADRQRDRRARRRHPGRDPRRRPRRGRPRRPRPQGGLRRPPAAPLAGPVGEVEDARAAARSTTVHERLAARIPEQGPATIVHGDYRLDNMILTARRRGRRGGRLGALHARRPARRRRPADGLLAQRGRRDDRPRRSRPTWRPASRPATS